MKRIVSTLLVLTLCCLFGGRLFVCTTGDGQPRRQSPWRRINEESTDWTLKQELDRDSTLFRSSSANATGEPISGVPPGRTAPSDLAIEIHSVRHVDPRNKLATLQLHLRHPKLKAHST